MAPSKWFPQVQFLHLWRLRGQFWNFRKFSISLAPSTSTAPKATSAQSFFLSLWVCRTTRRNFRSISQMTHWSFYVKKREKKCHVEQRITGFQVARSSISKKRAKFHRDFENAIFYKEPIQNWTKMIGPKKALFMLGVLQ